MQNFERRTQKLQETNNSQPEKIKVDYIAGLKNALNEVREKITNSKEFQKTDFKSLATAASLMLLISQRGNLIFESNKQIDTEPTVGVEQIEVMQPKVKVKKILVNKKYITENSNLRSNNPDNVVIHSTMLEGETLDPINSLGNTEKLAKNFYNQINGRTKKTGFTQFAIGRESEKNGVEVYQLLPTSKASEGTTSYARFKDRPGIEVDTNSIQVELNYNPRDIEAGELTEDVTNDQLDALASIVAENGIVPEKVFAHWAVQGTHPDGDWLGFNPQEANKNHDGRINPKLLRFVESVQTQIRELPNENKYMLAKLAWKADSKWIAHKIIEVNLKNAEFIIQRNKDIGVKDKSEIKPEELQNAIKNNESEKKELGI
jgi:hypothetical protein